MNMNGYASNSYFDQGLTSDEIRDKSGASSINLDATKVNIISTTLEHNGIIIPTGVSAVSNPMTANLDAGTFEITNLDGLKTHRIASQTNTNNIELLTADIQMSGNLDMIGNDILGVGNSDALTRTENAVAGELLKKVSTTYHAGTNTSDKNLTNSLLIGSDIGTDIISGTGNIVIGNNSCQDQPDLLYTIAIGNDSQKGGLLSSITGIGRNISIGQGSMQNIGGNTHSNTSLGYQAMFKADVCDNCIAIGAKAFGGGSGVNISGSTCLGAETRCAFNNSIALGYNVWNTSSDQCMIGNINLAEIVPTASAVCDLGSASNPFNNLQINTINTLSPFGGQWMATGAGVVVTNTVTPTNFIGAMTNVGSLTTSANEFIVGSYALNISGPLESKNGDTLTISFYAGNGGSTLLTSMIVPMVGTTGSNFELETDFDIQAIGAAGVAKIAINSEFTYQDSGLSNFKGYRTSTVNSTTFNTTTANLLNIVVEWSAADVLNSIQAVRGVLHRQY